MQTRALIIEEMQQIASAHKKTLAPLTDNTSLLNMGLDSLCFAVLSARLEEKTGIDPFSVSDEVALPVTFGDFVRAYERAPA